MLKVAFHNLGCKVNAYENERMIQMFVEKGHKIVAFDQKADIYVINTCTVTNIADRKTRQMIHRVKKLNPDSIVAACGCYVETNPEKAQSDSFIDLIIKNSEKERITEIVEDYLKEKFPDSSGKNSEREPAEYFHKGSEEPPCDTYRIKGGLYEHTRAYIKIQDGCEQYCSYCIIPYARGRVTSRSHEEILSEITSLSLKGCKEVVLTGIHLSSYGLDTPYNILSSDGSYTNTELIKLIKEAADINGIERIRLGSLEPRIITDTFLRELKGIDKFCPHFHISLQSGSDTVLKRMNRHYTSSEYLDKVRLIRKYFVHPAITTDVITGFPGESEEEFNETRRFLEEADLYEVHVFKYSRRSGTVADKMEGQHTDKTKALRSNILIEDGKIRAKAFRSYYKGRETEVLFEEKQVIDGIEYFTGYNREYVKCAIKTDLDLENTILRGKIKDMISDEVLVFFA
ncbi:MAG: tRNA (N(6)-L-threonylcarbamoyladenosine(37)-C(2))-methylthiotransferase MtaB [Lachnospiraceae bacterium]|nr:tRNA (N(6)-L-threonylcarbamoyladenosine(37)-C(2))-methylthiotransferase MtaB [Lachnospiraceae bacterium]